ncbi:hypothetical protein KQ878_03165 [Mycoplasma zalophidermidis]|uniref:Uncharacterized protein n=1 Tax=Mycoplasma zalophidermidis TaxID=398174 RepID=A0ABS6DS93_9MOLU|nr:hypothetical protein [Mycoplasma zalophidermidis]MBU4693866.1 hypothetical protein [Mycoplasma zalophidermidis]
MKKYKLMLMLTGSVVSVSSALITLSCNNDKVSPEIDKTGTTPGSKTGTNNNPNEGTNTGSGTGSTTNPNEGTNTGSGTGSTTNPNEGTNTGSETGSTTNPNEGTDTGGTNETTDNLNDDVKFDTSREKLIFAVTFSRGKDQWNAVTELLENITPK